MDAKRPRRNARCGFIIGQHGGLQCIGDQAYVALLVDGAHRGPGKACIGAQQRGQPRREQGMPAQVAEEVQPAAYGLPREKLGQGREQHFLGRSFGQVRAASIHRCGQLPDLECLAVYLARGQARHLGQRLETRGRHIGRQALGQGGTQRGMRRRRGNLGGHVEGDQLVYALVLTQQHRRGTHTRLLGHHGLDLAELHAKTAYLDLVVGPAQAVDLAVLVDTRQIPGAVQPRIVRPLSPGIG